MMIGRSLFALALLPAMEAFHSPPLKQRGVGVGFSTPPAAFRASTGLRRAAPLASTSSIFDSMFSSPASTAPPKKTSGADIVRRYFELWNERNMTEAVQLFSEDCTYEDTLYSGAFIGREAIKKHLLRVADALPDSFSFVLDEVTEGTDNVGVQWHVESNGAALPFTRGCSLYKVDPATQLITSGFDVPEPTVKSGSYSLAVSERACIYDLHAWTISCGHFGCLAFFTYFVGVADLPPKIHTPTHHAPSHTSTQFLSTASKFIDSPKRVVALGAWLFYCWFVFLSDLAPGPNALSLDAGTWEEVRRLSLNFWLILPVTSPYTAPIVSPVLEGTFNFLLAWAALFFGFIVDGRTFSPNSPAKQGKNNFLPFVVGMQFLTNAVYLPYLIVRPTPSQRSKQLASTTSWAPLSTAESIAESRVFPVVIGFVGILSLIWAVAGRPEFGDLGERLSSFFDLAATDRLTFSFIVDLLYLGYFQSWLLGDDAERRGYTGSLTLDSRVPFFGLVYWLLTRPPLPGVSQPPTPEFLKSLSFKRPSEEAGEKPAAAVSKPSNAVKKS